MTGWDGLAQLAFQGAIPSRALLKHLPVDVAEAPGADTLRQASLRVSEDERVNTVPSPVVYVYVHELGLMGKR